MKVLFAYNRDIYINPFVRTLVDSIKELGVDVTCSLDDFWHSWEQYEIIHLQWPNLLAEGLETTDPLKKHLQKIKDAGIPIVITCHNLHPHYANGSIINEVYNVVYDMVDCFIHMGEYSCNLLKEKYPAARHVIIPHHIYDTIYKTLPSKIEARKHLHLNPKLKYVLCFGTFRHDEEREIAIRASEVMCEHNGKVIAPSFSPFWFRRDFKGIQITIKEFVQHLKKRLKYRNIIMTRGFVSDEELPYYYAAADIALIHRREILNSGNLPMAFYMGKVVVGPNVGNVGSLLHETENPTFDINDISSLNESIKNAILLSIKGKGDENRQYAINNYSSKKVAVLHKKMYQSLIKDDAKDHHETRNK